MATQTGSIDLKAQKQAHDDAEKKATNYLTDVTSDGVFVHTSGNASTSTGSGVHIGASAIRIIKAGIEYIKAWISGNNSFVRIGAESINNTTQGNVLIDQDSVDIRKGTEVLSTFTSNGASLGKNSDNAEISMCNEQFKITAGEATNDYFRAELCTADDVAYPIQDIFMHTTKRDGNNVAQSSMQSETQVQDIENSTYANAANRLTAHIEKDGEIGNAHFEITTGKIERQDGSISAASSGLWSAKSQYLDGDLIRDRISSSIELHTVGPLATAEGVIYLNGNVYSMFGRNVKVLWTGGYFMTSAHTARLSMPVSYQLNGIVLVWSAYANGSVQNYDWTYYFVPKWHVAFHDGQSVDILMMNNTIASNVLCRKLVYVHDNKIVGNDNNTATGTGYANNAKVLRAVIGV